MATSVSGGRSRSTRREPPTMGKQLVIFITVTRSVTRLIRRVPLVEQELPEHLSSPPVFSGILFVDRCSSFFSWPLCCLPFLRILITPLVSSNSSCIWSWALSRKSMYCRNIDTDDVDYWKSDDLWKENVYYLFNNWSALDFNIYLAIWGPDYL